MSLAEQDRHHDDLDESKQQFIFTTMRRACGATRPGRTCIRDRFRRRDKRGGSGRQRTGGIATRVVCLPARDEADEVAGFMLAQLLAARGIAIEVMSAQAFSGEMIDHVSEDKHAIVCISALPPRAAKHVRMLSKRLRQKFPSMKIVVGLWQAEMSSASTEAGSSPWELIRS